MWRKKQKKQQQKRFYLIITCIWFCAAVRFHLLAKQLVAVVLVARLLVVSML